MRIGFDARMMTHPGIGRYIGCLLREMIKQAGKDEFLLFGDPEHLQEFRDNENVKLISWKAPVYSIKEQITLPYNAEKIDLLHVPHLIYRFSIEGRWLSLPITLFIFFLPGRLLQL